MRQPTLLYVAAPLFSVAERAFNAGLTTDIEGVGLEVFLHVRSRPRAGVRM